VFGPIGESLANPLARRRIRAGAARQKCLAGICSTSVLAHGLKNPS